MNHIPKAQEIYKHFKGNLYQITAIANHSETGEELVIYQALYGDFRFYARPLSMFMGKVDKEKYPDVKQEYRFELVTVAGQVTDADICADDERKHSIEKENAKNVVYGKDEVRPDVAKEIEDIPQDAMDIPQDFTLGEKVEMLPEEELDPLLIEFLDASTYEERLNILTGLHHKITNEMLTTMAVVCDIELKEGNVEDRYDELKNCLITLERFECNRLR